MKERAFKQIPRALALLLLILLYAYTLPPKLTEKDRRHLSEEFNFSKVFLYEPADFKPKSIRNVHPQYERISAWISSVGAAVALTDYDGDHLANDIVHVDPRFDQVLISPAPGTGSIRFTPFALSVNTLPYNEDTMAPMGTLINDFNEDGKIDVLVYYWGRTPVIFYQNDNGFDEVELTSPLQEWNSNTGTIADFNGDGHPDIFIGNYFPDNSKVLDANAVDNKQVMQHSMTRADNGGQNRIFLWTGLRHGKAIFKETKDWLNNLSFPNDWTLAVAAADINGDLLPEIYIANDFGPDKLLHNTSKRGKLSFKELKGEKKFNTISSSVVGKDSFKGMGVDFGDINGDGFLDIFVSNISAEYALLESHFAFINTGDFSGLKIGKAPFINRSESLGLSRSSWAWEAKLADFNNDGQKEAIQATGFIKGNVDRWPELQELATGNDELLAYPESWPSLKLGDDLSGNSHIPFFVQNKSGRYFDLASSIGLDEVQITRGIAISDIDHDGKLDFATANQWEPSKLYHNIGVNESSFLGLTLLFPVKPNAIAEVIIDAPIPAGQATRYALGATAKVKLPNGQPLIGFVDGGNGHSGKNSSEIHFGLGKVKPGEYLEVEISWRNAQGVAVSSIIQVEQGWHTVYLPW